jgi:hypothetical protein
VVPVIIVGIFNSQIAAAWVCFVELANNLDFVSVNRSACHALRIVLFSGQHIIQRQKLLIVGAAKPL